MPRWFDVFSTATSTAVLTVLQSYALPTSYVMALLPPIWGNLGHLKAPVFVLQISPDSEN